MKWSWEAFLGVNRQIHSLGIGDMEKKLKRNDCYISSLSWRSYLINRSIHSLEIWCCGSPESKTGTSESWVLPLVLEHRCMSLISSPSLSADKLMADSEMRSKRCICCSTSSSSSYGNPWKERKRDHRITISLWNKKPRDLSYGYLFYFKILDLCWF